MTTEAAYGPMQKDVIETKKAQDGVQNGVQPEVTKRWRPFHDLRVFLVVAMVLSAVTTAGYSQLNYTMRTLEKRFGLTSSQSGVLISVNDMTSLVCVLFIGYLGRKVSKPRLAGLLNYVSAVGVMLFVFPYFTHPLDQDQVTGRTSNGSLHLCLPGGTDVGTCSVEDAERSQRDSNVYYLLVLAAALNGVGNTTLTVLFLSYIDENISKVKSPLYIAIVGIAMPLGPVLGSLLSAAFLSLPENLRDSPLPSSHPQFIGCWWMPFAIYSAVIFLCSTALLFFPKHMDFYYKTKRTASTSASSTEKKADFSEDKKSYVKDKLKDVLYSFGRVLCNLPWLVLTLSGVFSVFMVVSLMVQMTKYLQLQFHVKASKASLLVGCSGILFIMIGSMLTGIVMRRFKIQQIGAARILIGSKVVAVAAMAAMFLWSCPQARLNTSSCDTCSCSLETTQPVCTDDASVLFPTPCHAGCSALPVNKTFTGCTCSENPDGLSIGLCKQEECGKHVFYLMSVAIIAFTTGMATLCGRMIQLRIVDPDLKPVALGLTSFFFNAFVFIPGPIIMGRVSDTTCLLWRQTCGQRANCMFFDMNQYRKYMHGISISVVGIGTLLVVVMYVLLVRKSRQETDKELHSDFANKGHVNLAVVSDGFINTKDENTNI